ERDALLEFEFEAMSDGEVSAQRLQGSSCRVFFGLHREFGCSGHSSPDRRDAHDRFLDAPHERDVAHAGERMAEYVETDADVADAAGGEGADGTSARLAVHEPGRFDRRGRHARAPRLCTTARISPNTPAAVTSGPAPGPCTT